MNIIMPFKLFFSCFLIITVVSGYQQHITACDCGSSQLQVVNIRPIIVNQTLVESENLMLKRTNQWIKNETEKIKCLIDRNIYFVPMSMKTYTRVNSDFTYYNEILNQLPTAWTQYYSEEHGGSDQKFKHSVIYVMVYKFWFCTYNDFPLSNPNIDPGYTIHSDIIPIAFNASQILSINLSLLLLIFIFHF